MPIDHRPPQSVVVWFEDTPAGQAAVLLAREIAEAASAKLTVLTFAPRERVIGCGRCISGTVLWNADMIEIAQEELEEAQGLLCSCSDVTYEMVVGRPVPAIVGGARAHAADVVVVPWRRPSRIAAFRRRSVIEKIREAGDWQLVIGPRRPGVIGDPVLAALDAQFS